MRTCKFCGCYLPDRFTVCVACHRDNNETESLHRENVTRDVESLYYYDYDQENQRLEVKEYQYIPGKYRTFEQAMEEMKRYSDMQTQEFLRRRSAWLRDTASSPFFSDVHIPEIRVNYEVY